MLKYFFDLEECEASDCDGRINNIFLDQSLSQGVLGYSI